MIDAIELRVGNWVEHNANWCYRSPAEVKPFCFQWNERDWYAVGECTMDLEDLQPIPLTPEILGKAGFKYTDNGEDFDTWRNKIEIWQHDKGFCHSYEYGGDVNYVHQLQNLYFSLTGTELIINL